jgi:hypothetical protein
VDINDLFVRFALDTITEFLLGKSVDSLHEPFTDFANGFAEVIRVQTNLQRAG